MKNSKEQILEKLRHTKQFEWKSTECEPDTGFNTPKLLPQVFISRLESVGGKGYTVDTPHEFANSIRSFVDQRKWQTVYCPDSSLRKLLGAASVSCLTEAPQTGHYDVSITGCECLIALTGSILASSVAGCGRKVHAAPNVHVVYAGVSQIKPFIKDGFQSVLSKPSWIGLITGPSRTADIEKTLVMGAHGPKELFVFIDMSC